MPWRTTIVAALAAGAGCAWAQQARFLEPGAPTVALGAAVTLTLVEGEADGAWPAERIGHFFARTAWTQDNRDTLDATPAAGDGVPTASWPADRPGVLLLGFELDEAVETVPAGSFGAFLGRVLPTERRALLGAALPADGEVSVRRVESAKALVRVSSGGPEPVSIATSKTGQAVELRPLLDPTRLSPGGDLPVKVYAEIPGPADGLILATNSTTGESFVGATREDATANLTIPSAGHWRLEFHAVVPDDAGEADWIVHTATLTFHIAAGGEVAK